MLLSEIKEGSNRTDGVSVGPGSDFACSAGRGGGVLGVCACAVGAGAGILVDLVTGLVGREYAGWWRDARVLVDCRWVAGTGGSDRVYAGSCKRAPVDSVTVLAQMSKSIEGCGKEGCGCGSFPLLNDKSLVYGLSRL